MKKILFSIAMLVFVGTAAIGATGAFFSDTETSSGNTFTAGAIDLKIDNESYYNGVLNPDTSWDIVDLTIQKFFNFLDVKPGDIGEDTISLHVDTNDSYLCAEVELTSDEENTNLEPEQDDGDLDLGPGEGELADAINFVWWADDGDNVLEDNETTISEGPIGALEVGESALVTLADSQTNIWNEAPGPVLGNQTYYIGKAWCFGALAPAPLEQDGLGTTSPRTPANSTGGIVCDGSALDNTTQTDTVTADVTFTATQSRNNPNFLCPKPEVRPATLTLVKSVNNGNVGGAMAADWTLTASGPSSISGSSGSPTVTSAAVAAGAYVLGETNGPPGYGATQYSCVINAGSPVLGNNINLLPGDTATCTITNTVNACSAGVQYADAAGTFDQGRQRNGAAIAGPRSDPTKALGAPQSTGAATDAGIPVGAFVSLGFATTTPSVRTASLVLSFTNNVILNGPGDDVKVFEVTNGTYPDEHIKIEASQDGSTWTTIAADAIRDASIDLGSLAWAKFIRVTDQTNPAAFTTTDPAIADGYDVDAVEALNCGAVLLQ